jgi:hypothetical protein
MMAARVFAQHFAIGVERQHGAFSNVPVSETGRPSPMLQGDAAEIGHLDEVMCDQLHIPYSCPPSFDEEKPRQLPSGV